MAAEIVSRSKAEARSAASYQATDPEALREHARCVGMPAETITQVADTVVIREDPVAAGK
jgi:hypothetical protein